MELKDEENMTWPSLTLPPTYGTYPSLSPWSFQRPYQQSLSGLLYPTTYPSVNRALYPWEISSVGDWSLTPGTPGTFSWRWLTTTGQLPMYEMQPSVQFPERVGEPREQPVVGYRAWRVDTVQHLGRVAEPILHATGVDYHWTPGKNVASCYGGLIDGSHPSPLFECHCGFWVFSDLDRLEGYIQAIHYDVVGAVMGWGRVIQHGEAGWRAQYARPLALLDLKAGKQSAARTKWVAKQYGLPVFEREALELVVREHDGKLPAETP